MEKSLTTGEIAKYCQVNTRTIIRWIDVGKLKGYKLPGRGNNRVLVSDFVNFLEQHDMPVPQELCNIEQAPSILIVDDELQYANAIKRVLAKENYECKIATSGFEAGLIMTSEQPALMTLDLSMPNMNGFDVISFVRQHQTLKHTKILVISALNQQRLKEAKLAGANDVLSKPFESEVLINKIAQLLARSS